MRLGKRKQAKTKEERLERKKERKRWKQESYKGARKRRFFFLLGWGFLVFSVGFGIYNNFTARDVHTIHETKVIDKQLKDVSGLENYVKNFVTIYFTVQEQSDLSREEALKGYIAEGVRLDNEFDKELKQDVQVKNVTVWEIEEQEKKKNTYRVTFHVVLGLKNQTKERAYTIDVYRKENQYAVVKLPVLASNIKKATIEVEEDFQTTSVKPEEQEALEKFLQTFFTIYPQADQEELKYYGKNIVPIRQSLHFVELRNTQFALKDHQVKVQCAVIYQDRETNLRLTMNYELTLRKMEEEKYAIEAIQ